jgi:pilus assembly protein CpaE
VCPAAELQQRAMLQRAGADEVFPDALPADRVVATLERLVTQVRERMPSLGKLLVLCGVSGGCGATTLALEMARELASQPRNSIPHGVILIEIPSRLGSLGTLLDLDPLTTSHDLLASTSRLQPAQLQNALVRVDPTLQVLCGSYRELPSAPATVRVVRQLIDLARQMASYVVVDLPCSFDNVLFEMLALADQSVLVGVQSLASMRALKLVRDVLVREEGGRPPTLVLNRYDPALPGFDADHLSSLLDSAPLLTVPADLPALIAALSTKQPLQVVAPNSGILRGLRAILTPMRGRSGSLTGPTFERSLRYAPRLLRVLHIEDDPVQQQIVRLHLASLPGYEFEITAAVDEQKAVEAFTAISYDLVILDYHLTSGTGLECLRRLRERDAIIPILVLSGLSEPHLAAILLEAGADDFLSKENLDGERLGKALRALLTRADGLKQRLQRDEESPRLPPPEQELLEQMRSLRRLTQEQPFEAGQVQRAVDQLVNQLEAGRSQPLPRKEVLGFFLRLFAGPES